MARSGFPQTDPAAIATPSGGTKIAETGDRAGHAPTANTADAMTTAMPTAGTTAAAMATTDTTTHRTTKPKLAEIAVDGGSDRKNRVVTTVDAAIPRSAPPPSVAAGCGRTPASSTQTFSTTTRPGSARHVGDPNRGDAPGVGTTVAPDVRAMTGTTFARRCEPPVADPEVGLARS